MAYNFIQLYDKNNIQTFPTKGPSCGGIFDQEDSAAYWYKFASINISGQYVDVGVLFNITKAYSNIAAGLLYVHARQNSTNAALGGISMEWVAHSQNIRPLNYAYVSTTNQIDLYYKRTGRYEDFHIEIIKGDSRNNTNYNMGGVVTLYSHNSTTGSTSLSGTVGYSFSGLHKVGDIICTTNSTNPSTYYGGTWEQITNKFLIGASSTYGAGKTGGSDGVTLTSAHIPAHTHGLNGHTHSFGAQTGDAGWHQHWCGSTNGASGSYEFVRPEGWSSGNGDRTITGNGTHSHWVSGTTGGNSGNTTSYGSSSPTKISIIPPWYGAYFWRRSA